MAKRRIEIGILHSRSGNYALVAEERHEAVVIPAEYDYSTEQVLIQPEQRAYVDIPAEYQVVDRQVLVSAGSSGWRRVAIPRHCG